MQREVVREYEEQTLAEDQDEVEEEGDEDVEVDMDEVDDEEEQEKKETPSEEIVSENVISAEAAAASTLALYKDVINDFLGVINFPKFNQEHHGQQLSKLEDDERRPDFWDSLREAEEVEVEEEEEEKEVDERFQSEEVSQYSYGSFLSEVYRVTLERMKQRVKI